MSVERMAVRDSLHFAVPPAGHRERFNEIKGRQAAGGRAVSVVVLTEVNTILG